MTNNSVIRSWSEGKPAKNGKHTLTTDGRWLYSYRLAIGYRTTSGICVLGDFTASSRRFYSMTTSKHIGIARRQVNRDLIWHPAVFEASKDSFMRDVLPSK